MEVHSWSQLIDAILLRKIAFVITFAVVFLASYSVLAWFDFLPELVVAPVEKIESTNVDGKDIATSSQEVSVSSDEIKVEPLLPVNVLPLTMTIEALDKTITIQNPVSKSVTDLDTALLDGAVRHPDSATLDQSGTVFILGHSSYLPVVRNKNFQAFNGIQNLKWGDIIKISAEEGEYFYRVDKVYRAKAEEVTVPIAGPEKRLFLATCNSFGTTADRYIVEADLIETRLF